VADNDTAIDIVTFGLSGRIGAGSVTGQIDKTINDVQGSGATLTERKELPMGRSVDARTDARPSQYLEFSAVTIKKRSIALFLMRLPGAHPGAQWIASLRRWYGIWFAIIGISDATTAAITTDFAGGVFGRLAGHTFLLAGLLIITLAIPLLATANTPAQRKLGKYWK